MDEHKKDRLFVLVFGLVMFLIPTTGGLILTILMQRIVFLEAFYIIFGVLTLIFALYRSRKRDNHNYKNYKDNEEPIEKENNRSFRNSQLVLYLFGVILLAASLVSFLIGNYVFHI